MNSNKDLETLIKNLPFFLQDYFNTHQRKNKLIEIVLDLGRRPEARFINGSEYLSQKIISWQDIDYITKRIGKFSNENRAGIERTLHRISCIRNRQYLINGLTCRIGRVVFGTISVIKDLLELEKSILILGKPGVGKTTIIREIGRVLANEKKKRVIIIDTSNEIAGESDIPHLGIGQARRMQVPKPELQHQIMIEAIENHMPEIIIVDEIGTELEVLAARTIAEKGVQLIGTTHGISLENLVKNPSLSDLIGGLQYVTIGDDEAKRRGTQKSVIERKSYPAFEIIIEITQSNLWIIHENTSYSIDLLLRNTFGNEQHRNFFASGKTKIKSQSKQNYLVQSKYVIASEKSWLDINKSLQTTSTNSYNQTRKWVIYPYSISSNFIKEALSKMGISFRITNKVCDANLVIGFRKSLKQNLNLKELLYKKQIPVYSLDTLSLYQFLRIFINYF